MPRDARGKLTQFHRETNLVNHNMLMLRVHRKLFHSAKVKTKKVKTENFVHRFYGQKKRLANTCWLCGMSRNYNLSWNINKFSITSRSKARKLLPSSVEMDFFLSVLWANPIKIIAQKIESWIPFIKTAHRIVINRNAFKKCSTTNWKLFQMSKKWFPSEQHNVRKFIGGALMFRPTEKSRFSS